MVALRNASDRVEFFGFRNSQFPSSYFFYTGSLYLPFDYTRIPASAKPLEVASIQYGEVDPTGGIECFRIGPRCLFPEDAGQHDAKLVR